MDKKGYQALSLLNFVLGVGAICLYLPLGLQALNIKGFDWLNFAPDILKGNYYNTLLYFGIFLLVWFIGLNVLSILSQVNLPKLIFKISIISALILPLIYTLAIKYDFALEFWIKTIAPNIKMISYILICLSSGSFILGLIFNFTKDNKANFHHILQSLVMSVLLVLLIAINGWCGWSVGNIDILYGILMSLFAIYMPLSVIVLLICAKKQV